MQCPECQTPTSSAARFCHACGTDLGAARAAESQVPRTGRTDVAPEEVTTRVAAQEPATDLRTCSSCGAPNSWRRDLCGRCGADLDSGISPPRPDPAAGGGSPVAGAPRATPDDGRRWPWVLGAGIGVAVLVAVGMTIAGLGPLAGEPSLPTAAFDDTRYAGEAQALALSDIATRTTLPSSGGEEYEPTLMADDDPDTAWNNDGAQLEDGVGETVDLFLEEPAWIHRLVITNGFQRDSDAYAANGRIRRAEVTFDGGERVLIRLEDLGLERQAVELPEPRLTTTVHIQVTETFEGDTHPDLAVSDLLLEGWVADDEDREVAEERAEVARAAPPAR